jgi:hypothetical protein
MKSRHDTVYRATTYRVADGAQRFSIRVGEHCAPLDALLGAYGADEWAYVTAYNPGGRRAGADANEAAQQRLAAALRATARPVLRGEGAGADGAWPAEPSLLVLGLPRADALALARRFGQEAIVAGRRGGPAELVYCEP